MATVTKPKKPARKASTRRAALKKSAPRIKITPPPGLKASEIADLLPPPGKDFDSDFVASIVASRSRR
ncbi:MAG: hypothetical protein ABII82_02090 [Verrucomicrobiota bacterium]